MTDIRNEIKTYDEMLQKHIDKKDYVKIFRTFKNREENISGFILAMSKNFLLVQLDNEFLLDGFSIIKKDQFDSLQYSKFEIARRKIFKGEGILDKDYGIKANISLSSWQNIFEDLKKSDCHVIVECEDKEEPDFIIGPIKRVSKDKVNIQYYDPAGQLEKGSTLVKYDEITIVTFDNRYLKTFRKYLKSTNPKK